MKTITALVDYKRKFGSKHFDTPYRSGMDKVKLSNYFQELGYHLQYNFLNEIDLKSKEHLGQDFIYTSSEDIGYAYKSYIEDLIFALELSGANVIPSYKHLRMNNNKVFMELMRDYANITDNMHAVSFSSLEDLKMKLHLIKFPVVFKPSSGASGTGVSMVKNEKELISKIKEINKRNYKMDFRDYIRSLRHKGYIKECLYREKFILQELIPNLVNDWKVYLFGEKLYIFKRPILKGRGIRASGGGYDNYFYGIEAEAPDGLFDFAQNIYNKIDVPHLSIDIAYNGKEFYLIEFQSLYFGTAGIPYSDGYFSKKGTNWEFIPKKFEIEKVYADSIVNYLEKKTTNPIVNKIRHIA